MWQSEVDSRFFDQVYSDVSVTEEKTMEDHALNYGCTCYIMLADNNLVS